MGKDKGPVERKDKFTRSRENGITFVYKFEPPPHDDILHIYSRHQKNPGDAMWIYFHGDTVWHDNYNAFITTLGNEELKWYWIDEAGKVLMVVHCLNID